jgi:predicted CDP-diglyceride synthetase/phosphatidate cytidylyltransferase
MVENAQFNFWAFVKDACMFLVLLSPAIVGGIAKYYDEYRNGKRKVSLIDFMGHIFTSGFVGQMTIYLCEWAALPKSLSGFLIGMTGYMGVLALSFFQATIKKLINKRMGLDDPNP